MSFDDRRMEFENKYAHDEELKFRIESRRNRLLGRWAAEKLSMSDDEADEYARSLVALGSTRTGEEGIVAKLRKDLMAAQIDQSEHQIRRRLAELLAEAEKQVTSA